MTTDQDPPLGPKYRPASRSYPELARFADDERRKVALRRATREVMRSRRFWLFILGALVVAVAIAVPVGMMVKGSPALCGGFGGLIGGTLVGSWVFFCRSNLRASLRRQLVEQGVPICLRCGYDLRGQLEPRCPECGTPCDPGLLPRLEAESSGDVTKEREPAGGASSGEGAE